MRRHSDLLVGLLIASGLFVGCTSSDSGPEGQALAVLVEGTGVYSRPISTDSELAQQFFDQGLRLTWGYSFPESIASYQEALRHDVDHPMIHWGLALAIGPNPNSRYGRLADDPQGEGQVAISRALELMIGAGPKERALIETLYVRYDRDSFPDRDARDQAYLEATRTLYQLYPEDPDVVTLFADAYMVTTPWDYWEPDGQPKPSTEEVARALENIMALHPGHPGANHLYIHLIEAGPTPERALPQADRLGSLMPIAGHVVHMPSHIYVRVGQHEKAIASNERSVAADGSFLEIWGNTPFPQIGTYGLSAQNHRRHAYDFVRYAAGIQGNYKRAIEAGHTALEHEVETSIEQGPGQRTVAAVWLVHKMFGRWDELLQEERSRKNLPYLDGMWFYVLGSAHLGRGEIELAEQALADLQQVRGTPALETVIARKNPVSTILELAALALEGEIWQSHGDLDRAITAFQAAVQIEDNLTYTEPPDWAQPMRHYLGAALLEAGRAAEAEQVYRRDMEWNQNNGWALFGLWQSLEAQGKTEESQEIYAEFQRSWSNADVNLSRSRF